MNGTVKKIVEGKPFGFIGHEGGEKDIFFHESALVPPLRLSELKEGDAVSFEVVESNQPDKGPAAANVQRA